MKPKLALIALALCVALGQSLAFNDTQATEQLPGCTTDTECGCTEDCLDDPPQTDIHEVQP